MYRWIPSSLFGKVGSRDHAIHLCRIHASNIITNLLRFLGYGKFGRVLKEMKWFQNELGLVHVKGLLHVKSESQASYLQLNANAFCSQHAYTCYDSPPTSLEIFFFFFQM